YASIIILYCHTDERLALFALCISINTATTDIYTLSLHDALPILSWMRANLTKRSPEVLLKLRHRPTAQHKLLGCQHFIHASDGRSEEHTSELQSQSNLVCRLLLEKKKYTTYCTLAKSTLCCNANR